MKSKIIGTTSIVVLAVFLGVSASGYAAQDHHGEKQNQAKPPQNSREQANPAQRQAHEQPRQVENRPQHREQRQPDHARQHQRAQETRAPQQRERTERQSRYSQSRRDEHRGRGQDQQRERRSAWQEHRAGNWQSDHRNWQQRGGYNGYRIPDYRFRGYFGRGHGFRIGGLPFLVVGGYPRFQYEGYWFSMVDPYPGNWSDDWYDTDDVYVGYADNGYYLYNRRHPGIGLAISVSM